MDMGKSPRMVMGEAYEPFLRAAGLDDFASVMRCRRGERLVKPNLGQRERFRLELSAPDGRERTVYLKRYAHRGPAMAEWAALLATRAARVPTMDPVAMGAGSDGGFVILGAVPGDALSRCMGELLMRRGDSPTVHNILAASLGALAGRFHGAGLAHRDFYTTHIFAAEMDGMLKLHLIDLARVFRPSRRRWRWWLKDLSQLKFSLPPAWRSRHWPQVEAAYQAVRRCELPSWGDWTIDRRVRRMTVRSGHVRATMAKGA